MPRIFFAFLFTALTLNAADKPNILWITSEDNGQQLGCYGDEYAITPNLDALASRGMRYEHCWSNAPVCAASRTCIITGMYGISNGGQHMRSMVALPEGTLMYPEYLTKAGYFCTNKSKEDYNHSHTNGGSVWHGKEWEKRADGQPFFAIHNLTISHESQIRNAIDERDRTHDPALAPLPDYHPDTPELRKDWAQYYDRITMMDKQAGDILNRLEDQGLAEDTIIFYYGDHGSGMPRSKRMPYNSGLEVPLIVHFPEKWKHLAPSDYQVGGQSDHPVSFVDLAPSVISLTGQNPPANMQGIPFMGLHAKDYREYNYGFRGRMDERPDCIRSITDGRYVYLRNFNPHRPWGQYVAYMFVTPSTQTWSDKSKSNELTDAQSYFWAPQKSTEELYDLESDPHEVNNLTDDPAHTETRDRLRTALFAWQTEIRDTGMLPEDEMHRLAGGAPIRTALSDNDTFPFAEIHAAATLATDDDAKPKQIAKLLSSETPAIRYWGAIGLLFQGAEAVTSNQDALTPLLDDDSPSVQIAAAEALGRYGIDPDMEKILALLITHANPDNGGRSFAAIHACNALDYLDAKAAPARDQILNLPPLFNGFPRTEKYTGNLIPKIIADIDGVDFKQVKLPSSKEKK